MVFVTTLELWKYHWEVTKTQRKHLKCSQFVNVRAPIWRQGVGLCNLSHFALCNITVSFNQQSPNSTCQSLFLFTLMMTVQRLTLEMMCFVATPTRHYPLLCCGKNTELTLPPSWLTQHPALCVCVCVCVSVREREREAELSSVREREVRNPFLLHFLRSERGGKMDTPYLPAAPENSSKWKTHCLHYFARAERTGLSW